MTALSAYATGMSRWNIEQALRDAGKNPAAIEPADLATLEDFHTLGRLATAQLVRLAGVTQRDRVLDAGTGIGGTARVELTKDADGAEKLVIETVGAPPKPAEAPVDDEEDE